MFLIITSLLLVCLLCLISYQMLGRNNSAWLEQALASIGDAIVTTDKQGCITKLNDVAEKLTGWTIAEARGKPSVEMLRMVDHDTRKPVEDPIKKVLSTGKILSWAKNTMLISKNGGERPIDATTALIISKRGSVKGAVIIFRDKTEQYTSEQKLLESEERLKAVTDAARIGLVMIDRERRYVYANKFYMQMLGISNTNLIGKRVPDVLPVVYEQIRPNLDRCFAGEQLSYEVKGVTNKEKGLNRYYSVTYEPQKRQSLVMHVVIVVVDITDIKRASEI